MFPKVQYGKIDFISGGDFGFSPLIDGAIGGSVIIPNETGGLTRITGTFLLRGSPRKVNGEKREYSMAGNISLQIPLGVGLALTGKYTYNWDNILGRGSISGISIAKAIY